MTNTRLAVACVVYACEDLKIPIVPVEFVDPKIFPSKSITAMFLPEQNMILFNQKWLSTALPEEIALTAFHEARHAYQKFHINSSAEETKEIQIWKKEFSEYLSPVNESQLSQIDYASQSIEIDAIEYSRNLLSCICLSASNT